MKKMTSLWTCTLLLALSAPAWSDAAVPASGNSVPGLQTVLDGSWRSALNRARDAYRHPAETLAFFQVRPDARVIEVVPGSGWYSEILAPLIGWHGTYTAAIPDIKEAGHEADNNQTLRERFAADKEHFGAASVIGFDPKAPVLGAPGSADIVLTFRNVHNWVKAGTEKAYFKAFYDVLRPGGILGIEDHRAKPGTALDLASGYLPEDYVIQLATEAGFRLDARSEINANPRDTKDYPKGVWTLPPALTLGDQDRAKYQAIGESDRFTLRFVKGASRDILDKKGSQP